MTALWCEHAWLGGAEAAAGVRVEIEGGRIADVHAGVAPGDAERLNGLTIPGLANAHSHAFQRALRGRAQGAGSFWSWREQMYALAETIDPDGLHRLARATFAEMALAGVTIVGEFHYLHHAPGGAPYADPNELGRAVIAAAAETGIRIVLLDACYLHGGSARFRDASAEAWAERVSQLDGAGAAIHSVRAVDPDAASLVAGWAATRAAPLHAHVSEQQAENAFAADTYGATPTALLERAGALSERFTAIHATHPSADDITMLGGAGATVCLCPTTERDLADGIGPARALAGAGARLALGSDSQAVIDLLEEARAVELDERLASGERGRHGAAQLLGAATAGGYTSLGLGGDGGRIAAGALADLTTIALDSVRLAGTPPLEGAVFCAGAADVRDVMVGGRWVVRGGAHVAIDVARELREVLAR